MRELLLEIWASVRRNKLRTFLTGFSVAWGIFMLSILLGSGNGLRNGTMANFQSMAINSINIYSGWTSIPYGGYDKWRKVEMTNSDIEMLKSEFPEVDLITAQLSVSGQTFSRGREYLSNVQLLGTMPETAELSGVTILSGRYINRTDIEERRKVIVLDRSASEVLFGDEDPVGHNIRIGGLIYQVVGLYKKNNFGNQSSCYIPLTTAQQIYAGGSPKLQWLFFSVQGVNNKKQLDDFELRLRRRLAAEHSYAPEDTSALYIHNNMAGFRNMLVVFTGIDVFIWIIGLGTLLAGVVGVSNIMLVTVQERTFEFGIRKALGAKPSSIIRLILTESTIITATFGYIGMVLGVAVMEVVNALLEEQSAEETITMFLNPTLDLSIAFSATVVLVVAGLVAGYVPARRAAQLKTIDALRHNK